MGRALSTGAHDQDPAKWQFVFFDPHTESAKVAAEAVNGEVAESAQQAANGADLVLLAVKPQVQAGVLHRLDPGSACLVSIAAGRSLADMERDLDRAGHPNVPIVRVMPNVNASVAMATSALCANGDATPAQVGEVRALFDSIGTTVDVPEKLFGAFTAMAGSSPAWYFRIANSLAMAGVDQGLTKAQAIRAAASAMQGSAALLLKTLDEGGNAEELVDRVCSPGGTTVAGLLAAERAGLSNSLVAAVNATVARNRELGG